MFDGGRLGNDVEGEGRDRTDLGFPVPQQALLEAVQAARGGAKLVLAINSAGGVDVDPSGLDAVVQLWYGGQETGHGLADVLWGRVNPSGRLPLTVHKSQYLKGVGPVSNLNMTFGEQGRTYRRLASQKEDAWFSFGWGLSYSKFQYSDLKAGKTSVSVTVENAGSVAGAEVAQLYLGLGSEGSALPAVKYALAGFEKVMLAAGAKATVTFPLEPEQLTVVGSDGMRKPATGAVSVSVAGHLPTDPRATDGPDAKSASNAVAGSFSM